MRLLRILLWFWLGLHCVVGYSQRDTTTYSDEEIEKKRIHVSKFLDEFFDVDMLDKSLQIRQQGKNKAIVKSDPSVDTFVLGTTIYSNLNIDAFWSNTLTGKWIYTPDGKVRLNDSIELAQLGTSYYTLDFDFQFDTNATKDGFYVSAYVRPNRAFQALIGEDSATSLSIVLSQLIAPKFKYEFEQPREAPIPEAIDEVLAYLKLVDPELWQQLASCSKKFKDLNSNNDIKRLAESLDFMIENMDKHQLCVFDENMAFFVNYEDRNQINAALLELNQVLDKNIYVLALKSKYIFNEAELGLITNKILAESKLADVSNTELIFCQQLYNYNCHSYFETNQGRFDLISIGISSLIATRAHQSETNSVNQIKDALCKVKHGLLQKAANQDSGKYGDNNQKQSDEGDEVAASNFPATDVICGQSVESTGLHVSQLSAFVNKYNNEDYLTFLTPAGSEIWISKDRLAYVHFTTAERWRISKTPLPMGSLHHFETINGDVFSTRALGSKITPYENKSGQPYIEPVQKTNSAEFVAVGMTCIKNRQFSFEVTNVADHWNAKNHTDQKLTEEDALLSAFTSAKSSNAISASLSWKDLKFDANFIEEVWGLMREGKATDLQKSFEAFLHMYEYDADLNRHKDLCSIEVFEAMQKFKRFAHIDLSVDENPFNALFEAGKNGNDHYVIYHQPEQTKYNSSIASIVADKLGLWPYTFASRTNYYTTPLIHHTDDHGTARLVFHYHDMYKQYSWLDDKLSPIEQARKAGYVIDINCTKSYINANKGQLELKFYGYMVGNNVDSDDETDCEAHVLSIVCEDINSYNEVLRLFDYQIGQNSFRTNYGTYKNEIITTLSSKYNQMSHDQICGHIDLLGNHFSDLSSNLRIQLLAKVLDGSEFRTTYGEEFGLRILRSFQEPLPIKELHHWLLRNNGRYLNELLTHYSDVEIGLVDKTYSDLWYIILQQCLTTYNYDLDQCTDQDIYPFQGYNFFAGAGFSASIDGTDLSISTTTYDFNNTNGFLNLPEPDSYIKTYHNPFEQIVFLNFHYNKETIPAEFQKFTGKMLPVPAICLYILDDLDDNARLGSAPSKLLFLTIDLLGVMSGSGLASKGIAKLWSVLKNTVLVVDMATTLFQDELKLAGVPTEVIGYIHNAAGIVVLTELCRFPAHFALNNRFTRRINWEWINQRIGKLSAKSRATWDKLYKRVKRGKVVNTVDDLVRLSGKSSLTATRFNQIDNLLSNSSFSIRFKYGSELAETPKQFLNTVGDDFFDLTLSNGAYVKFDNATGRMLYVKNGNHFFIRYADDGVNVANVQNFMNDHVTKLRNCLGYNGPKTIQLTHGLGSATSNPNKVLTFIGKTDETQLLKTQFGDFKHIQVGETPGAINLLNRPDTYWNPATWFRDYNGDWIRRAINRGDDIYIASPINRNTLINKTAQGKEFGSYYANELNELVLAGIKPKNITQYDWNQLIAQIKSAASKKL